MEIHVFDFDGTLFKSPKPPEGWDSGTWWVSPESLDPPCVPETPDAKWWNPEIVSAARKAIASPDTLAVLATGRKDRKFRWRIPELLRSAGLQFDEVHLSDKDETLSFKKGLLASLLRRYPQTNKVRMWEDRATHVVEFENFLGKLGIPHDIKLVREKSVPCALRVASRFVQSNEVIYVGAFLTDMSRQKLLRNFPPKYENVHADHTTLVYDPSEEEVSQFPIGKQVRLKVTGYVEDTNAQAVLVEPQGTRTLNRIPHITISTAPGVKPEYSNTLLKQRVKRIVGPTLTAVLDTYPSR